MEERSFIIRSEKLVMVRDRRLAVEGLESRRVMAGVVAVASDAGAAATSHIRLLDAETGGQLAATTAPAFDAGFGGGWAPAPVAADHGQAQKRAPAAQADAFDGW